MRTTYLSLIEIPITARFDFWKYFFLNGGVLLDFDITKDKDLDNTGIGTMLGVGIKYDFKNRKRYFGRLRRQGWKRMLRCTRTAV